MKNLNNRLIKTTLLIAAIACANQHLSASTIPIDNGDFEAAGSSGFDYSDVNAIVGWTVEQFGDGTVGVQAGTGLGLDSADGSSAFIFQASNAHPTIISQTLTGYSLTADTTYTLTLDVGQRYPSANETLSVALFAGSTELTWTSTGANLSPSGDTATPQAWSFTYVSSGTPLTGDLKVELTGAGGASDLIGFDNISLKAVSAVPEPSTYALLFGGLGMLALLRLRKARV